MKKRLGLLILSLLLCSMFVCVATATTTTKTESGCLNKAYNYTISGSVSKLTAEGYLADSRVSMDRCYTTLFNTSSDSLNVSVEVREYDMLTNSYFKEANSSLRLLPNTILATEALERDADNPLMRYEHIGIARNYVTPSQVYDTLIYKIFQQ